MELKTFTGGIFDTNCFALRTPQGWVLIDAPQDCDAWLARENLRVDLLLLTHGHIDHVADAGRIARRHRCRVGTHPVTVPMVTDPDFFRRLGFQWEIDPVAPDILITETPAVNLLGLDFQVLEVPGHCPGSLCFFLKEQRMLFGGDVLFAGGVGRWDLPGGDRELLFTGIREKILPLGDDVRVFPGHGPVTTIGQERRTNPFVCEA